MKAEAILLVQSSVFQIVTPEKKKRKKNCEQDDPPEEADEPAVGDIDEDEGTEVNARGGPDAGTEDASDETNDAENALGTATHVPAGVGAQGSPQNSPAGVSSLRKLSNQHFELESRPNRAAAIRSTNILETPREVFVRSFAVLQSFS